MIKILQLFTLLLSFSVSAQTVFLPSIGTKWHYLYRAEGGYNILGYVNSTVEYKKDSVVDNETVKVLKFEKLFTTNTLGNILIFIKQRNDSVFFKHPTFTANTWQLLINYTALPNKKWSFTINYASTAITYTVRVNSVSTVTVNNYILKKMNVEYFGFNNSVIYERFGDIGALLNIPYYDGNVHTFDYFLEPLCYEDSSLGLYQFSSKACDYPNGLNIYELTKNKSEFELFPNPATNHFIVKSDKTDFTEVLIYNSVGAVVRKETINPINEQTIVYTSSLSSGIYFVQLKNKNLTSGFKKIGVRSTE